MKGKTLILLVFSILGVLALVSAGWDRPPVIEFTPINGSAVNFSRLWGAELISCDTIDTDGDGLFSCGTDDVGDAGAWTVGEGILTNFTARVGIGTLTPGNRLDVVGNVSVTQNISADQFINQGVDVAMTTFATASTGLLTGGFVALGPNNTVINITAGTGLVINSTDQLNIIPFDVMWDDILNVSVDVAGGQFSDIGIDENGNVVLRIGGFSNADRRDVIFLGRAIHPNQTGINDPLANLGHTSVQTNNQVDDLAHAIGVLNINGNEYSSADTNLSIQKSSGSAFSVGVNFQQNVSDPNTIDIAALPVVSFFYTFRNGAGGFNLTDGNNVVLDVARYDDGSGTLASVNNNQWTFQTVFLFVGVPGDTIIHYGQEVYNSQAAAEAAIGKDPFSTNPVLTQDAMLRGFILVRGGATDLSLAGDAKFINAGKFGGTSGSGTAPVLIELDPIAKGILASDDFFNLSSTNDINMSATQLNVSELTVRLNDTRFTPDGTQVTCGVTDALEYECST